MKKFLLLLLLLLSSCAHIRYVPMPETYSRDSLSTRVNTYVDSTIIDRSHTERQRADTLVIHDSVFIRTYRYLSQHDTIRVVERDSIPYPVEVASAPIEVEKPIPRFYKNCTIGFFLLLLALLAYITSRLVQSGFCSN